MGPKERILSLRVLNKMRKHSDYEKFFTIENRRSEEHCHKKRKDKK